MSKNSYAFLYLMTLSGYLVKYLAKLSPTIPVKKLRNVLVMSKINNRLTISILFTTITVFAWSQAPVITFPGAQTIQDGNTLTFTGGITLSIADGDTDPQTVVIDASGVGTLTLSQTTNLTFNNATANADNRLDFTGPLADVNAALDGLVYDPSGDVGAQSVVIDTDDGNGGTDGPETINVFVNTVPVITVPSAQTIQDGNTLTFTGGTIISIADTDGGSQTVVIDASGTGTFTLSQTTNLTFNNSTSNGDNRLDFTGPLADVNAALDGLVYDPSGDLGAQSVVIDTDDGNGGTGGPETVNVNINQVPVLTFPGAQTIQDGNTLTFTGGITLSIADGDTDPQTVVIDASGVGTLTLSQTTNLTFNNATANADNRLDFTGPLADVNAALDGLVYDPSGDVGAQSVVIDTDDGNGGTDGPETINVFVNTVPVITVPGAQTIAGNEVVTFSAANIIAVSDLDGGDQTVIIEASGSGTLTLSQTTGLTFNNLTSNGDNLLDVTGSLINVNAALDGLIYASNGDVGAQTVSISTDDSNGGTDGPEVINVTITPYIVAAYFYDDGDNGIDEIVIELSENIDESSVEASDFGLTGGTLGVFSNFASGNIENPLDASATDQYVTFEVTTAANTTVVTGLSATYTASGGTDIASNNTGLPAPSDGNLIEIDRAAPLIVSQTLDPGNVFLEVTFSEGLYTTLGGALSLGGNEFTLNFNQNGGTASDITIDEYTQTDDVTPTAAGDNVIRFQLATSGVPDGNELIELVPTNGSSVFDNASPRNAMDAGQTTGSLSVNSVDVGDIPTFVSALPSTDNSFIVVEFSIPVDDTPGGGTGNLEIRTFGGDSNNPELRTRNFQQNGGGASNATANNQSMTASDGSVQASGTTWRFTPSLSGGTPQGVETFEIFPRDGSEVYGTATNQPQSGDDEITVTLADEVAEDFGDAVATALDTNADGNIDQVEIVMPDGVDDNSIEPGDFDFNGSIGQTFDTGTTSNDNTFRITFTDYVGTAVIGNLDYQASRSGTLSMRDDAEYFTYEGIILGYNGTRGNVIADGSLTLGPGSPGDIIDGAGPVIISATTEDTESTPDGYIDQINIVFSEDITEVTTVVVGDITLSAPYQSSKSGVTVGANNIILSLNEQGSADTYIRPTVEVAAGIVEDPAGAQNPLVDYGQADDGAAPFITLVTQTATDQTPDLSGTVDDPTATILLTIDGNTRSAVNDGIGGWTFTNASNPFTLTELGGYDVTTLGIDIAGNNYARVENNGYILNGGVVVSHNGAPVGTSPTTICGNNQFEILGNIVLDETSPTDFSIQTGGNLLLELPDGFIYNENVTLTILDNGGDIDASTDITYTFLSESILELTFDVSTTSSDDVITIQGIEVGSVIAGSGAQLIRGGGDLLALGINEIGSPFAEIDVTAVPSASTDVDVRFTAPNVVDSLGVVEVSMLTGATFSATPNGAIGSDTIWYNQDSVSVLVNSADIGVNATVTQADILPGAGTIPGLFTRFVAQNTGGCDSEFLTVNFLVYSFDDGGFNDEFEGATYDLSASDDPFDITFSLPAGHTAEVVGTPVSSVTTNASSTIVTIDPNQGDGSYPVNYILTNQIGQSVTLTATFNVTTTSPLYEPGGFFFNGVATATDNEYCINDQLLFEVNNAHVTDGNNAGFFFYAIGWMPQSSSFSPSSVRLTEMQTPAGANLTNDALLTSNNPLAGWSVDLEAIYALADSNDGIESSIGLAARESGIRLFSIFFNHFGALSVTIDPNQYFLTFQHPFALNDIPRVNISGNETNYCIDDDTDYTLQALVDPNGDGDAELIDMDNGYELWNADYSGSIASPDALFNPSDFTPGTFNIVYETDPNLAGCTNLDTLQILINDIPSDPDIGAIYSISMPNYYLDNTDIFNSLPSYVFEVQNIDSLVSGGNNRKFIVADDDTGRYNWYNDNAGIPGDLILSATDPNSWLLFYPDWFDDPTTGTVEQPAVGEYVFYYARTINGCESTLRKFTIYIYEESSPPLPLNSYVNNLNNNVDEANFFQVEDDHYIAEYCENYVGNEIIFDGPDESASNPTSRTPSSYFNIYSSIPGGASPGSIQTTIDDPGGAATLTAADFGYSGTGAFDTTIYMTQVWNDRTPGFGNTGTVGVDDFEGTESDFTRLDINIFTSPDAPTIANDFSALSSLELHVCEGENFTSFVNSGANIDEYIWYNFDGSREILRVENSNSFTSANLLASALPSEYDNTVPSVYTFQVSRIEHSNNITGFTGCESTLTEVTIEVHSIEGPPTISSPSAVLNDTDPDPNRYKYSVCLSEIDGTTVLNAESAFADPKVFNWYNSNAAGAIIGDPDLPRWQDFDPNINAGDPSFSDLGVNAADITTSQSRYYVVAQQTDIDDFEGCRDLTSGLAFIEIEFVDDAALSFEPILTDVDVTSPAEIASNNQFCYDEGDINVVLQADGSPIAGADLASLSYTVDTGVIPDGTGNPTIDLQAWHLAAGGLRIGGPTTTHILTMQFTNPNGCVNGISTSITIHPDPDVTFENTATPNIELDNTAFCYDDDPVTLRGVFNGRTLGYTQVSGAFIVGEVVIGQTSNAQGEVLFDNGSQLFLTNAIRAFDAAATETIVGLTSGATATINSSTGANLTAASGVFTKTGLGLGATSNNEVIFDPAAAHGNDPFAARSSHLLTFSYVDENGTDGCGITVSKTVFVDPRPELSTVNTGSPEDGELFFITNLCDDESKEITAEIRFIDPIDPTGSQEEDDYSGYTFNWFLDGRTVALNPVPGELNTNIITIQDSDFVLEVDVTDPNGCTNTYEDFYFKQSLPMLEANLKDADDFVIPFEFCSDEPSPTLELIDNNDFLANPGTTIDASNVDSWSITSRNSSGTLLAVDNGSGVGSLPSFTELDLKTLHENAGGNTYEDFGGVLRSVGGDTTYHEIEIFYTDPELTYQGLNTNCQNSITTIVTIFPAPNVNFNIADDFADFQEFCYQQGSGGNIRLEGFEIFSNDTINLNTGLINQFFVDGEGVPTNNGVATINTADLLGGQFNPRDTFLIEYQYTDDKGCAHFFQKSIIINPLPQLSGISVNNVVDAIQIANSCVSTEIEVFVEMQNDDVANYRFDWTVNGGDPVSQAGVDGGNFFSYELGEGETNPRFGVSVTYIPNANVLTSCSAESLDKEVPVGQLPNPKFSWVGLTEGRETDFSIFQENETLPGTEVQSIALSVNGVQVYDSVNSSINPVNIEFPIQIDPVVFETEGQYSVDLRIRTSTGCDTTVNRTVNILPHLAAFDGNNPYMETFINVNLDNPSDGWWAENRSTDGKEDTRFTSWTINANPPGELPPGTVNAVYSNYNQTEAGETSFIYTPSIDLRSFNAPTISFLRYEDFESDKDGVVLQYSVDDGRTWQILGTYEPDLADEGLASTPGWYDNIGIISVPGREVISENETASNPDAIGWASDDKTWEIARVPLPSLADEEYMRFRFALASQAGQKVDATGFGFSQLEIYDRDQVVLLELFSSSLDANSINLLDTLSKDDSFESNDILIINYFTDLRNGARRDPLNERNTTDPSAKSVFYGIDNVPSIAISGDPFFIENPNELSVTRAKLDNAKLAEPGFTITIDASVDPDDYLEASAQFTATRPYPPATEIGLFIAIVEPEVTLSEPMGDIPVGSVINNVLRKILTDSAGTFNLVMPNDPLLPGEILTFNEQRWAITKLMNQESLRVIAYAQDLNTGQVYQAASVDLPLSLSNPLGLEEQLSQVELYPNPASNEFTMEFGGPLLEDAEWVLYDQSGRAVQKGALPRGKDRVKVYTKEIPSGLYLIHLYGEERKRQSKRVIVVH